MIEMTATASSVAQGIALLDAGVDTLYIGMEEFGLRLPADFSLAEQAELIAAAHARGKKVTVAVNGIMHPDKMLKIPAYLKFLKDNGVDQITLGDPGIVYVMQQNDLVIPYLYDAETLVTSARQINFWGKRGAIGAVLAREVPFAEMEKMVPELDVFAEVQVFGPTCIHQSKRPLLQNYFNYVELDESKGRTREWFLSEPKKPDTHYAIYEDSNGTHVFADNDLDLMPILPKLRETGFTHWKLDGLFCPEDEFVTIVEKFIEARAELEAGQFSDQVVGHLDAEVRRYYPAKRGLDLGFFDIDPDSVK